MEDASACSDACLSGEDARRISEFDSRDFGFLNLQLPDKLSERRLILKAIKFYECKLQEYKKAGEQKGDVAGTSTSSPSVLEVYYRLGHLNLLIHDFAKALSAYQKFITLNPDYWKDAIFLYGLGLVYFHFNLHRCAVEVFQKILYSKPNFVKSADVHLRLGLSSKALEKWPLAFKHLNAAFVDSAPCIIPKLEIKFHMAHCHDLEGDLKAAHDEYNALLQSQNISGVLRASLYRHLGWLVYRSEFLGDKNARLNMAISCLQESLKLDPTSGKSYYYLGRCFSVFGRAHDAFVAYRHSIDKSESSAETWCSIGVLYQQQQQPMDALQAFICAIQLDEKLSSAWIDLGLLYEHYFQFKDALQCYKKAAEQKPVSSENVLTRIRFLETQLKNAPAQQENLQKNLTLPSLEDAWHLPIPAELMNRQDGIEKHKIGMYSRGSLIGIGLVDIDDTKQHLPLSPQQLQLLHILQQNQAHLNPQQVQTLRHLQETYAMSQQGKIQQRPIEEQNNNPAAEATPQETPQPPPPPPPPPALIVSTAELNLRTSPLSELPQVTQEDLQAFLGITSDQDDLTNGLTDQDGRQKLREPKSDPMLAAGQLFPVSITAVQEKLMSSQDGDSSQNVPDRLPVNFESPAPINLMTALNFPVTCSANEIINICKHRNATNGMPAYDEQAPLPKMPVPGPTLSKDKLLLPTPTVIVDTKKDANGSELQQFCYRNQFAVIKSLTSAIKLDLGLFSTKKLLQMAPDFQVEVRTQLYYPREPPIVPRKDNSWTLENSRSITSIAKYAHYQMQSFQQSLKEEHERNKASSRNSAPMTDCDLFSKKVSSEGQPKVIKFGNNVDLSDDGLWNAQLQELMKLPVFCRVFSSANMLSHLGHTIPGVNCVRLSMKVPGCRTAGHQEPNNLVEVNINIGPGECEWFAVPYEYWPQMAEICEKYNVDFVRDSWWPNLEDLWQQNIPVFRYTQKPGDIVWVGSGVVHWIQATGWCNCISWNVGPLTSFQYTVALQRYEWNRFISYKSALPLIHLTWQLAQNIRFAEPRLFDLLKQTLARSLVYCQLMVNFVAGKLNKELKHSSRTADEVAHYCRICEAEVFNLLYVTENEGKYLVHCLHCALRIDPQLKSFTILIQYLMDELATVYNEFVLIPKKQGMIC